MWQWLLTSLQNSTPARTHSICWTNPNIVFQDTNLAGSSVYGCHAMDIGPGSGEESITIHNLTGIKHVGALRIEWDNIGPGLVCNISMLVKYVLWPLNPVFPREEGAKRILWMILIFNKIQDQGKPCWDNTWCRLLQQYWCQLWIHAHRPSAKYLRAKVSANEQSWQPHHRRTAFPNHTTNNHHSLNKSLAPPSTLQMWWPMCKFEHFPPLPFVNEGKSFGN